MPFEEPSLDTHSAAEEDSSAAAVLASQDPSPTESQGSQRHRPSWQRDLMENVLTVLLAVGVSVGCRSVVAEPRWIPSGSMLPTLEIGDRLVVEKISYRFHPPRRGDIVVFYPPFQERGERVAYIKRVIGIPGDRMRIEDGQVFIAGVAIQEEYIEEEPYYSCPGTCSGVKTEGSEFTVPEGSYFVMGDNRNDSRDSHEWGFLPRENIIGHTIYRFWPLNRLHYFRQEDYPRLQQATGSVSPSP